METLGLLSTSAATVLFQASPQESSRPARIYPMLAGTRMRPKYFAPRIL